MLHFCWRAPEKITKQMSAVLNKIVLFLLYVFVVSKDPSFHFFYTPQVELSYLSDDFYNYFSILQHNNLSDTHIPIHTFTSMTQIKNKNKPTHLPCKDTQLTVHSQRAEVK